MELRRRSSPIAIDDANSDNNFDPLADQTVSVTTVDDDVALDFGDAPTAAESGFSKGYPTKLADDGARHASGPLVLGTARDMESDGQPNAAADADDVDGIADEDGVFSIASMVASTRSATGSSIRVVASQVGQPVRWFHRAYHRRHGGWVRFVNSDG